MTTQIPPAPKRQRLTAPAAIAAKEAAAGPVSTVICQFRNAQDGTLLGPAVSLPADTGREGLELLVNNLRGTVSSSRLSLSLWFSRSLNVWLSFCIGCGSGSVLVPSSTAFDSQTGFDRGWRQTCHSGRRPPSPHRSLDPRRPLDAPETCQQSQHRRRVHDRLRTGSCLPSEGDLAV